MADPYEGIGVPVDPYAGIGVPHPDHSTIGESVRHLQGAAMASPGNAPPAAPTGEPAPLPWSDLPGNIIPSVKAAAGNMWHAISHPIDTATSVGKLAQSALAQGIDPETAAATNMQRIVNPEGAQAAIGAREAYAKENAAPINAFASNLGERYGSPVRLRNTIIGDPAGFALDASLAAPGIGEFTGAGKVLGAVGRELSPVTMAGRVVQGAGKVAEPIVANELGLSTGAGASSVRAAGSAGRELGSGLGKDAETVANAQALTDNLSGKLPLTDALSRVQTAQSARTAARSDAYKAGMGSVENLTEPLDFGPIDKAIGNANDVSRFKGVSTNPSAAETQAKLADTVRAWRDLDAEHPVFEGATDALTPENYHTPIGLDALKRIIGDIRDEAKPGSASEVAANRVYNAVKDQIVAAAPEYANTMERYAKESKDLKETSQTFSLKGNEDTAIRKLMSTTNTGVGGTFLNRQRLLGELAQYDSTLPYAVAGQALNSLAPRGLVARAATSLPAVASYAIHNPLMLGALPLASPKVVGTGAYYGGRAVGAAQDLGQAAGITGNRIRAAEQGAYRSGNSDQSNGAMALAFRRANERRANALAKRK